MSVIAKDVLLGATDIPRQTVHIPELKGDVIVRGMTAAERTQFEKKFVTEKRGKTSRNFDEFREQLCVTCLEQPRLSEADIKALSMVRADVLERITNVAMKLSGISEKDVDELGLSSETTTPSSSPSGLPTN